MNNVDPQQARDVRDALTEWLMARSSPRSRHATCSPSSSTRKASSRYARRFAVTCLIGLALVAGAVFGLHALGLIDPYGITGAVLGLLVVLGASWASEKPHDDLRVKP